LGILHSNHRIVNDYLIYWMGMPYLRNFDRGIEEEVEVDLG
jgi:hypothetical protein